MWLLIFGDTFKGPKNTPHIIYSAGKQNMWRSCCGSLAAVPLNCLLWTLEISLCRQVVDFFCLPQNDCPLSQMTID